MSQTSSSFYMVATQVNLEDPSLRFPNDAGDFLTFQPFFEIACKARGILDLLTTGPKILTSAQKNEISKLSHVAQLKVIDAQEKIDRNTAFAWQLLLNLSSALPIHVDISNEFSKSSSNPAAAYKLIIKHFASANRVESESRLWSKLDSLSFSPSGDIDKDCTTLVSAFFHVKNLADKFVPPIILSDAILNSKLVDKLCPIAMDIRPILLQIDINKGDFADFTKKLLGLTKRHNFNSSHLKALNNITASTLENSSTALLTSGSSIPTTSSVGPSPPPPTPF
jgi:hypothetical protein